ncbi:lysylphosphatidylglycerol synthase domain-containing protein [Alsobacter metallidurans]|uniref:lysylphosphatidylglycerol synthase domain-containing protein n=1 Tax=Alsobacter metallidurans TaxID=340221 RepID=UPI00166ABBA6|nr:lysylphosphatidylglycerol synthase domain-containing protein [Alsobacter metallidurans]
MTLAQDAIPARRLAGENAGSAGEAVRPSREDAREAEPANEGGRRRFWSRLIGIAAVLLSAFLIWHTLRQYSLDQIVASVKAVPAARLWAAGAFAAASYCALTGFDYLALRYVGKPLPYWKAALASFTSLGLGHSIGFAGVSSGAIRYRYYARWGLTIGEVAKLVVFCGVTVGVGLAALGGIALLVRPELGARVTGLDEGVTITLGALCLVTVAAYVGLAFRYGGKSVRFRRWSMDMPEWRLAAAQVVVGAVNFALVAGCLHQALAAQAEVGYLPVASVYVIANTATMITHVPGGLGVIESVVSVLLPGANLIGGLLAFRAIYFFIPLGLAALLFGASELVIRRRGRPAA